MLRWLQGDPAGPPPPDARWDGRNREWTHLNNMDVISMPDKWEYPWYAAWDLAFHCVALAHVDPEFAKSQLILLCREWYMHPNGQLPAYEWSFGDVNPPVHAWAALRVYEIAGDEDYDFLERILHKLLLNFTWWVNRKDADGNNLFEGGFLGLDNIGPFDRSSLPVSGRLEQSDGTAWMAMYCQNLLELALLLAEHDPTYEDLATKFFEHFALIASALNDKGLWNEEDGFYYDLLHTRRRRAAAARAVDRRPAAARGGDDARPGDDGAAARLHGARRRGSRANRPEARSVVQHMESARPRRLADALDRRRGAAAPDPRRRCSTRPSSSPTTACGRSRASTRRTRCTSTLDGVDGDARLRAGRVDERPLRRQLELARPDLVPGQLPARRDAPRLPPLPRRRLHGRVPDRLRAASSRLAQVADELSGAADRASSSSARTAAGRSSAATSSSSATRPGTT